ncbi:hypothetical protein [Roseateles sp. P5_E4]
MESDATVRGQLVPHGSALASRSFIAADAGKASPQANFFQPNAEAMSADDYRAKCVLAAHVGLGLFASAATGVDASGPAPFCYEPRTRDEISALCSRLMELVRVAPVHPRASAPRTALPSYN